MVVSGGLQECSVGADARHQCERQVRMQYSFLALVKLWGSSLFITPVGAL